MPKISEIKQEGRLDTGLYTQEFKKIDNLIKSYGGGCENLGNYKIKTGRTPQDYFYKNHIEGRTFLWLTPKYIKKNIIISKQYLFTKQDTNLESGDIIFTGIGSGSQGNMLYYDEQTLAKLI